MFGSKQRTSDARKLDWELNRILKRLEHLESAPSPEPPPGCTQDYVDSSLATIDEGFGQVKDRILGTEAKLKELTFAVEEGIERVGRSERRIKATVARARKELQERGYSDPGLEAEAHELRVVDGDGGEDGGVQPVPAEVGGPPEEASSIRGVPASTLQRVRGM